MKLMVIGGGGREHKNFAPMQEEEEEQEQTEEGEETADGTEAAEDMENIKSDGDE